MKCVAAALLVLSSACVEYKFNPSTVVSNPAPDIEVNPSHITFGALPEGAGAVEMITIINTGTARLELEDLWIEGSAGFTILESPLLTSLQPDEETEVMIAFTATEIHQEGALAIQSNASEYDLFVPMSGQISIGALLATPNPVSFGNVDVGDTIPKEVLLSNIGYADVTVESSYLQSEGFSLLTSESTFPIVVPAGENKMLELAFSPLYEGLYSGSLWLSSDGLTTSHMVGLRGSSGDGFIEEIPEEDPCLDPDGQYDQHPEAKLMIVDGSLPLFVEYTGTSAGYTNELWLEEPAEIYLATGHSTPPGQLVDLQQLNSGSELKFRLDVLSTGDAFYSGPSHRNPDGRIHVAVTYLGECRWSVGFEDQYGGGDQDFDDITLIISGNLEMQL